jgi:hypothetical protein
MELDETMFNYLDLLDGCKRYIKNEPRDLIYKIATRIVSQSLGEPSEVAEGITILLSTWNFAFYRGTLPDVDRLEKSIRERYHELKEFKVRDIESLTTDDNELIEEIFNEFKIALRRGGRRPAESPVSAAKALHLIAPNFFPLWDDSIAEGYGCGEMKSKDYVHFMYKMREVAEGVIGSYIKEHGGDKMQALRKIWELYPVKIPEKEGKLLKWIDEYNWVNYFLPKKVRKTE